MATFGYTSIGASSGNRNDGSVLLCNMDAFPSGGGDITSVSFYSQYCSDSSNEVITCLYDDSSAPNNLLAESSVFFDSGATSAKWVTGSLTYTASSGEVIYVGRQQEIASTRYWYDTSMSGYTIYEEVPAFGSIADPWGGYSLLSNTRMSAYVTYTAGGGGTILPMMMHYL